VKSAANRNEINNMDVENKQDNKTPEIRYVPVEMIHGYGGEPDDADEIDLLELAKTIWAGRNTIIKITLGFIIFGVFWALFSAEEFESEAILMPEVQQTEGRAGQLLQRFGGAFGLGGLSGSDMPQGTIPPMIYPRIVNSLSFQLELMEKELYFRDYDVTTTWPDFLENHFNPGLTSYLVDYTVKLPITILGGIRSLLSTDDIIATENPFASEFISITEEQQEMVDDLRSRISVNQDKDTGLLTTKVKLQDARAAAELNRHLIELLKEYVTDYRIEKARQNLEFSEQQRDEAEVRFERTQLALAEFLDANRNINTARLETELERLQDEKNLALNIYNSLSQRYEEARITLQEQTPIFKVVQAVSVPSKRSEPNRPITVIVFTLLGGILAIGIVLLKPVFGRVRDEIRG
jgi:LPS O-antigen subunit length determinant protein (WzzB/FepE family)